MSLTADEAGFGNSCDEEEEWGAAQENAFSTYMAPETSALITGQLGNNYTECPHPRAIIHVDVDSFYAQVEMLRHPEHEGKPLGVYQRRTLVTANFLARQHGVGKMTTIRQAQEICPDIVLVKGEDLEPYRQMSYKMTEVLHRWSPHVERLGLDDNFVDVTETLQRDEYKHLLEEKDVHGHTYQPSAEETAPEVCRCGCRQRLIAASHIAAAMRKAYRDELGLFSCCSGIAHSKLLCHLVVKTHKPNQQTTIFPEYAYTRITEAKTVNKIPGIGGRLGKQLEEIGIKTVLQLREVPELKLEKQFGKKICKMMKQMCLGIDHSPVIASGPPQSLNTGKTYRDVTSVEDAILKLGTQMENLLIRQQRDGRGAKTLRVSVSYRVDQYRMESRQCAISADIFKKTSDDEVARLKEKLMPLASNLLVKLLDTGPLRDVRVINVGFTKFVSLESSKDSIKKFFAQKTVPSVNMVKAEQNRCVNSVDSCEGQLGAVPAKSTNSTVDSGLTKLVSLESPKASIKNFFAQKRVPSVKAEQNRCDNSADSCEGQLGAVPEKSTNSTVDSGLTKLVSLESPKASIKNFFAQKRGSSVKAEQNCCDNMNSADSCEGKVKAVSEESHESVDSAGDSAGTAVDCHVVTRTRKDDEGLLIRPFGGIMRKKRNASHFGTEPSDSVRLKKHSGDQNREFHEVSSFVGGSCGPVDITERPTPQQSGDMECDASCSSKDKVSVQSIAEVDHNISLDNLAPDVDPDVFRQLPPELQREILHRPAASNQTAGTDDVHHSIHTRDSSVRQLNNAVDCGPTGSPCKQGMWSAEEIPPDTDVQVFLQLPLDMQKELVAEWKLSNEFRNMKSSTKSPSVKKSTAISQFFRRK